MKKYFLIFTNSIQISSAYRLDTLNWFFIALIATASSVIIFGTATNAGAITNYSVEQITSYIIFSLIIERVIGWYFSLDLSNAINKGELTKYITKPYNGLVHFPLAEAGRKVISNFPYIVVLFLLFGYLIANFNINLGPTLAFTLSVMLASVLGISITAIVGMSAFWTNRSDAVFNMYQYVGFFAAGRMFPLDIFPKFVLNFLNLTPFPYLFFYPTSTFIRGGGISDFLPIIGVQVFWILILIVACRFFWKKGIKNYESVGI